MIVISSQLLHRRKIFAAFVLVVPAGVFLEDLLSVVLEDFVESFGVGIMSSAEVDGKRARRAIIFIILEILFDQII